MLYFFRTFKIVFIFIFIILLTRAFIIEPGRVNGRSMEPTYFDNNIFFINKFILLLRTPFRGEIIQFYDPDSDKFMIKRVVGMPGETIEIKQNKVFIIDQNGIETQLQEPYIKDAVVTRSASGEAETYGPIPEHEYFLLGDNRTGSTDSRYYGFVHRSYINGSVLHTEKTCICECPVCNN